MGVLHIGHFGGTSSLGIVDDTLAVVMDAADRGFDMGLDVRICAYFPPDDGYVAVDSCVFVPGVKRGGKQILKDMRQMYLRPIYDRGAAPAADGVLVDQVLKVMQETDGCIVLDVDDELITVVEEAKPISLGARRLNPFEDIVFPNPSH